MKRLDKIASWILWLMFAAAVFVLLITFTGLDKLLVAPLVINEPPQKVDVIIVLGGGVVTDLRILPWAVQERVQEGADLFKAGFADKIIVSGGLVKHQTYTESEFMKGYAVFLGIKPDSVIEENQSHDTRENALFSKKVMEQNSWKTALLVTSDFHSGRACKVFKKVGVSVTCISAFPDEGFKNSYFRHLTDGIAIMRDYAAVVYYWLRGYI